MNENDQDNKDLSVHEQNEDMTTAPLNRRSFIKAGIGSAAAVTGLGAALSPLKDLEGGFSLDKMLQDHYDRLTPEQMEKILERIKKKAKKDYGVSVNVTDPKPMNGVEYAYALNIGRCIGCRRCVYACMKENNNSRSPELQYIRVLEMKKGSLNVENSDHYYDPETVPQEGKYYLPVQCHHCEKAPCTKVCPVRATWKEPDGIVVVDYDWCIGCRYCEAACPYWARRFNFSKPVLKKEDINPEMSYLGNRIRPKGVIEKCTFCLTRTRQGKNPACLEVCPTGSRVFGNLLDEDSSINYILREKRVYVLKEELGTIPRFYYFFDK